MTNPTREDALNLLTQYTKTGSLINHAKAVEAVMRHYAKKYGEDMDKWGIIGLVHDLDWEQFPDEHCERTTEILRGAGWPEDWIRSVRSHAWGMFTEDKPESRMEMVLYTIDELTGLITAAALVRPSRSILDMSAKSVKKKWKIKSFAAGANREVIANGADMLGESLDEIITDTITGMRTIAAEIGLAGSV